MRRAPARMMMILLGSAVAVTIAIGVAGCGLNVKPADLFVIERSGQGKPVALLISDDGTIHCNDGPVRTLSDPMLLQARDLASSLDGDVKSKLHTANSPRSVYSYAVKLQDGTLRFEDTAAAAHKELAQAELFFTQAAHDPCGLQ